MHPSRLRFSYAGGGGSAPGSGTEKERGWGAHQRVKAAGGARARRAVDGAVEGGGVAQTAAGRQLLGGSEEAQDGATRAQGICGKERRRSIGAPQMGKGRRAVQGCSPEESGPWKKEEESCGAAHRRRGVSAPIYRGGAAGRRVVGIRPAMAAIKVSNVERHRRGERVGCASCTILLSRIHCMYENSFLTTRKKTMEERWFYLYIYSFLRSYIYIYS
jgi:hypothetical protein